MRRASILLLAALLLLVGEALGQDPLGPYGGWSKARVRASGFYRTAKYDGRWWLVDPEGRPFFSLGVGGVGLSPEAVGPGSARYREAVLNRYGWGRRWGEELTTRLHAWGFNTLGPRSDRQTWTHGLAYTVTLDMSGHSRPGEGSFPDVFAAAYAREATRIAQRVCVPLANDPWLLGYFTDGELPWGGGRRAPRSIFAQYLGLEDGAEGRKALLTFLEERYLQIEGLNEAWRSGYASFAEAGRVPQVGAVIPREDSDDFLALVAARYFRVAREAIRGVDRNHLILGCQFVERIPAPVLRGMVGQVNVISLDSYQEHPPTAALREIYRVSKLPLLLSGFSFRSQDSGLSNARGRGPVVATQQERGQHYERYLAEALRLPMTVGCFWSAHTDTVGEGEDSNGGLVNVDDEPYRPFVEAVHRANQEVYSRRTGGRVPRETIVAAPAPPVGAR
jgi:hypothetical protein